MVKVGDGTGSAGVKVGDRVGIKWVSSACLACRKSQANFPGLVPDWL